MTRHGAAKTPEYQAWSKMISRCEGGGVRVADWGGRGIKIDPAWRRSFERFLADVGPRPGPNHSIERINNNGDYTPSNVRWATAYDQSNNRRCNIRLDYQGQDLTLAQACRAVGVNYHTAYARIRRGVDPLRAITTPTA